MALVYTSDLTSGKTCASNNTKYPASWAFDDDESNYSYNESASGNWVSVDFGSAVKIEKLRIYPWSPYVGDFSLQGSNDNSDWITVMTGNAPDNIWYTFEFSNSTAYRYYRILKTVANYLLIREAEMMAVVYNYKTSGSYLLTPIAANTLPEISKLFFTCNIPNGTSLNAEYAITNDNLTLPSEWTTIENEGQISFPNPSTGFYFWLRFNLSTTDSTITPSLSSVWISEASASQYKIQLNLTYAGRMKHPQGNVTVLYTNGLWGPGPTAVAGFSQEFTPTDIIPWFNPNDPEYVKASIYNLTLNVFDVNYASYKNGDEYLKASVYAATVVVTKVGELPL